MEKQRVNDTVVKLGNLIGKGRTFVVHRLSGKIRDLRRKDEKKFQNRINRLLLEIAFLKTLTNSRSRKLISRRILMSEDDHVSKIESDQTEPNERAFHRLCREKCIAEYVSKFREDNIDWKYWVPPLLDMWQQKQSLKQDRIRQKDTNKDNKQGRPSIKEIARGKIVEKRTNRRNSASEQDTGAEDEHSNGQNNLKTGHKEKKQLKRESQFEMKVEPSTKRSRVSIMTAEDDSSHGEEMSRRKDRAISNDRFIAEELSPESADSSGESDVSEDQVGSEKVLNDQEEPDSDDADEEVVFNRKNSGQHVSSDEDNSDSAGSVAEVCSGDEDGVSATRTSEADGEESTSTQPEHEPFRPYALKRPVSSDSDDSSVTKQPSGSEDIDTDEESEAENPEDDEESSDGDEDVEVSDSLKNESSEDSEEEDQAEIRRKRKLLLGGLSQRSKKELQIDFSVQEKLQCVTKDMDDPAIRDKAVQLKSQLKRQQLQNKVNKLATSELGAGRVDKDSASNDSGDENEDDSGDDKGDSHESDEGASFFLKEGETAKEVPSKTIPKESAPALNRRERRGHERQKANTAGGTGDAGNRFIRGENFQGTQRNGGDKFRGRKSDFAAQDERPFRGRASAPFGRDKRSPFPGTFRQGHQSGHQPRADHFEGRKSFGGTSSDFRGRRIDDGKSPIYKTDFESCIGTRTMAQGSGRGAAGDLSEGRKNLGGSKGNSRIDVHQKNYGGRGDDHVGGFVGHQEGQDRRSSPRQDGRNSFTRNRGDDRQNSVRFERQKSFQKELPTNRSFNNAGSRASFQKDFQGRNQSQTISSHEGGHSARSDEKLHPSWLAKKKLSAAINQPFQGKKIIFSDDPPNN